MKEADVTREALAEVARRIDRAMVSLGSGLRRAAPLSFRGLGGDGGAFAARWLPVRVSRRSPLSHDVARRTRRNEQVPEFDVQRVRDAGERVNGQVGPVLDLLHPLHRRPQLARERLLGEPLVAAKFRDTAADVADQAVGFVAGHGARRSQAAT